MILRSETDFATAGVQSNVVMFVLPEDESVFIQTQRLVTHFEMIVCSYSDF